MKIDILTLFPEMFEPIIGSSIIGRARESKILDITLTDIRAYSKDKHKKADDYPFGGGQGMVMSAQPIFDALRSIGACGRSEGSEEPEPKNLKKIIYMSPRGKILDKQKIEELSKEEELIILCGHYEGVDQRVIDYFDMEEISIGDFILTGGELPAMVLVDSISRLVPGVLPREDSAMDESIYSGLLEYPQYTKPRSFEDMEVPEVLISGNHKLIELWKFEEALKLTKARRPDLFAEFLSREDELDKAHKKILEKIRN